MSAKRPQEPPKGPKPDAPPPPPSRVASGKPSTWGPDQLLAWYREAADNIVAENERLTRELKARDDAFAWLLAWNRSSLGRNQELDRALAEFQIIANREQPRPKCD